MPHPPAAGSRARGVPAGGPPVGAGAVSRLIASRWTAAPDAPALRAADRTGWIGAGELAALTAGAAAGLAAVGLEPGERLLWSAGSAGDAVVAALACLRLGAVLVPANPQWTERELAQVVTGVEPAVAVVSTDDQRRLLCRLVPATPCLAATALAAPGHHLDAPAAAPPVLDAAPPAAPAVILHTSGTTGAPKGAVLTQANLAAAVTSLHQAWGWTSADRLVSALPLFHGHGLCVAVLGSLAAGGSVSLLERFDAAAVLDAVERDRATLFFGVPTMYHRLVAAAGVGRLAALRLCVSGSAPLAPELWHRLRDRAGIEVLERYGMTETLLTVSNPLEGERRAGSIGFPLPGVDVRVEPPAPPSAPPAASPPAASPPAPPAPSRSEGELWVRGPSVFPGYWRQPEATASSFTDGWFRTGDIVSRDAEGRLWVRGRSREVIITGGFNVYPVEVEQVLAECPGVAEVAVAGEASPEWGETVGAWVVREADLPGLSGPSALTAEALLQFAAGQLTPYKRPRAVHFVESLPRNAMGKVVRSRLA